MDRKISQSKKMNEVLQLVNKALQGMEYGEVIVKVQAGRVTVIDKIERKRLG